MYQKIIINITNLVDKFKKSRLLIDSFWSLLGSIVGRGLALVSGILVARFLNAEVFGEYTMIKNTIIVIGMFSTFGLGYTSTKYVADFKNNKPEYIVPFINYSLKITLLFSGIMACVLFLLAEYIATVVLEASHLKMSLRILSILIVFNALTTTQAGILSGFGAFKNLARVNASIGVVTFVTSVTLSYFYGLDGALIALLFTQVLNWFFNYNIVKNYLSRFKSQLLFEKPLRKEVVRYTTPIALQELTYTITSWLGPLLLIKYATYTDLGIYNAAAQWKAIILFIPSVLRSVILSHLSENNKNEIKHSQIMKKTIWVNLIITSFCALIVFVFSGNISAMYGKTFDGLGTLISVAVFTTIFTSTSNIYVQAYMSKGLNWVMYLFRFFRDAGIIIMAYCLITNKTFNFSSALILIICGMLFHFIFLIIMYSFYKVYLRRESKILEE